MPPDFEDLILASIQARIITDKVMKHQARSSAWLMVTIVSLLLSSLFDTPASASTAWGSRLINWQSNLFLYFAGAALILCIMNGARATFLHYHAKKLLQKE